MTKLLVSVRNAEEAEAALAGGAHIIDVKEPSRGALGFAGGEAIEAVAARVRDRRTLSAACGEMIEYGESEFAFNYVYLPPRTLKYIKLGLSSMCRRDNWRESLDGHRQLTLDFTEADFVVVAYADWQQADSPRPYDVVQAAIDGRFAAFLIDTWQKDGKSLLDWISVEELTDICRQCRDANVLTVLAGSLKKEQILRLLPANPDFIGVRGAACVGNDRLARIDAERVAELVALLSPPC